MNLWMIEINEVTIGVINEAVECCVECRVAHRTEYIALDVTLNNIALNIVGNIVLNVALNLVRPRHLKQTYYLCVLYISRRVTQTQEHVLRCRHLTSFCPSN